MKMTFKSEAEQEKNCNCQVHEDRTIDSEYIFNYKFRAQRHGVKNMISFSKVGDRARGLLCEPTAGTEP